MRFFRRLPGASAVLLCAALAGGCKTTRGPVRETVPVQTALSIKEGVFTLNINIIAVRGETGAQYQAKIDQLRAIFDTRDPASGERIVRGDGMSRASRAEMMRPQVPITSIHQFPTLLPDANPDNAAIGLATGLGLVTFQDPRGEVWFKGGHNEWTGNMVVCVELEGRCLALLSNDVRAERLYPDLVRAVLGDIRMPWSWEYEWFEPAAR